MRLDDPQITTALQVHIPNPHSRRVIVSHATWLRTAPTQTTLCDSCILRELRDDTNVMLEQRLHTAIHNIITKKLHLRCRQQLYRRLYQSASFIWYTALRHLDAPLQPLHPPRRCALSTAPAPTRVFTPDEVDRLIQQADRHSPQCGCLFRLLFTTGLRIAAAQRLAWHQLRTADGSITRIAVVEEKGRQQRAVYLGPDLRRALHGLTLTNNVDIEDVFARPPQRHAVKVRQLRNWWYAVCEQAGLSGPHCHPHNARP